jgi:HD-GYP domain-containing protein (c-di-GMP phosphodiesterase class II)
VTKENIKVEIEKLKQELADKNKKIRELELMHRISRQATGVISLDKSLKLIIDEACRAFKAEMGSVLLLDKKRKELTIWAQQGLDEEIARDTRLKIGERISGWVAEHKEPVLVLDVESDIRFAKRQNEKYYTKSLICTPVLVSGELLGVININNKGTKESFTEHDLDLLVAIAEQAGIIIHNANNYKELQGLYMNTISALTEAIDARDHYTKSHSEHVTEYALGIAEEMKLDKHTIDTIQDAGKLHDVGKIGIHDYILMKPGKLTLEEWEEVKMHSLKGEKILEPLTFLNGTISIIRSHHERYDGKGYPDELKGEEIPIGARILAVADSFDAMTTERPYRKVLTAQEAKEELIRSKGKQFDPQVVDAFLGYLKKRNI